MIIEFDGELKRLIIFNQIVKFENLVHVELLEKIVESQAQEFPYYNSEVRVLTSEGECYLLAQSANKEKMLVVAKEVAQYVGLPFVIDDTFYRL